MQAESPRVIGRRPSIAIFGAAATLAAAAPALALDPDKRLSECTLESWRTSDGLPSAWVRTLAQTGDGYLWIGTPSGLVRYGGGPLLLVLPGRAHEHASDVTSVMAARDGTVWVAPARGAPACVRDGVYAGCFAPGQSLPDDARVTAIHEDAAGTVWLASSAGIYRVSAGRVALAHPASAWGGGTASAVHHDHRGRLWVGTPAGLFVADYGRHAATTSPSGAAAEGRPVLAAHHGPDGAPVAVPIASIAEGRGGRLWVVGERTLVGIDGAATTVFRLEDSLRARRPTQVVEDLDGNVWIGSRKGLVRYQPGRGFALYTSADGLPDDDVSTVFADREGSLWVGTRLGGVVQLTDRSLDTRRGPPSQADRWISTVAEDAAGALWVGTDFGVTRWKDGLERTFTPADGLPADRVQVVLPAPDGTVWVGTDRGLARWRGGRFEPAPPGLEAMPVSALYRDQRGVLWVGGADARLARLDPDGTVTRLGLQPDLGGPPPGEIRALQHDDRGILWASASGRMLRVDDQGRTLIRDRSPDAPAFGRVRSIHRDDRGALWLGTRDGLIRRRAGTWRRFAWGGNDATVGALGTGSDTAEQMAQNDLYQVASDDQGHLWAGSGRGILRIPVAALDEIDQGRRRDLPVLSFETSDQRRDVGATRIRQPGVWKGRDGRLWFATSRGVVSADPRRVRLNRSPPTVVIESASAGGRPARRGAANRFPPGSGTLEFQFAAITLIEPRKAHHRYRLEGFDAGWIEAGTRRAAYYTNIGPGTYRFRVQGANADGVWNEAGDSLELTLLPHLHQTFWFYAACALAALAAGFAVHRLRVARLRAGYAATFSERTRVARELHDSLLQGMAATLMRLRGLRKEFPPRAGAAESAVAREIQEIEQVVASNIEETRQFVWNLRDQAGAGEPAELGQALELLAHKLASGNATAPEVRVEVEGEAAAVPPHVRRELLRVTHEAITNALRHARARHVDVRLRYAPAGDLALSVEDDGCGFDAERAAGAESGRFGLTGMRERAAALGTLAIASRPGGGGTRVEITVNREELRDG